LPPSSVCAMLDCDSEDVVLKIESGILPYAWDLRIPNAAKAFLRILARSVSEIQSKGKANGDDDLSTVIDSILPHHRDIIRSYELGRMFSCDPCHITHLIKARCLEEIGSKQFRTQPRKVT